VSDSKLNRNVAPQKQQDRKGAAEGRTRRSSCESNAPAAVGGSAAPPLKMRHSEPTLPLHPLPRFDLPSSPPASSVQCAVGCNTKLRGKERVRALISGSVGEHNLSAICLHCRANCTL